MTIENLYRFVIATGCEIALLLIVFALVYLLFRMVLSRVKSIAFLQKYSGSSEKIQRKLKLILIFFCLIMCIGAIAFNVYLLIQKQDTLTYVRERIATLPDDFWIIFCVAIAKVIGIVIAGKLLTRLFQGLLTNLKERAKKFKHIKANDKSIENFFVSLNRIQKNSIWLLVFIFLTMIVPFPVFVPDSLWVILKVYLIFSFGILVVKAADAIVDSLDAVSKAYAKPDNFLAFYDQLRQLIPLFRRCLEYVIYVCVATLVMMQIELVSQFSDYGQRIIKVIGIFFLSRVVVEVVNLLVDKSLLKSDTLSTAERQRRLTVVPLIKSLLQYLVYFVAFVLMLAALKINVAPILAGAGILGIVIGLGAQPLINDLVSGFFILFENLYLVDDYIEIGPARGMVEAIDIRTTRIRDPNGQLHILRNGQINEVINYSKTYIFAVVELGVAYDSNLDHVYKVLTQLGEKIHETNQDVIEPTQVKGLKNFGASELTIRTLTKVKPGRQRAVARQLRKMIKEAFDEEGIEIPFPRRVVIYKEEKKKDQPD